MKIPPEIAFSFLAAALTLCMSCSKPSNVKTVGDLDNSRDWGIYRGDQRSNQFSSLEQINAENVQQLEVAWTYRTGDATGGSSIQSNPIVIDGILYFVSPAGQLTALDAASGEAVWKYDPRSPEQKKGDYAVISRGATYWSDGVEQRIFYSTDSYIHAVDAKTGERIDSFGENGKIDFRYDLGVDPQLVDTGMTSPPAVFENFLILGTRVGEGFGSSPGHIRAYDTVTGEFRWIFHTIPQKGEFGHDTWDWVEGETYGGANPWGGLTVDEERGWVFAATGSPTYDFYGANRKGQNLFGNCVLALNARTGERIWHYQTVHHDIWDMDNPPAPILVDLKIEGKPRDAVVQMTKMGYLFVLDRETGEPIFEVEERPVPKSDVPGEEAWSTQPFPLKPPPLVRQGFTENDLAKRTPEVTAKAKAVFEVYGPSTMFKPVSTRGHVLFPGMSGGMEYHGASFDTDRNLLYVNVNESSNLVRLQGTVLLKDDSGLGDYEKGKLLYQLNCSSCHGLELRGLPPAIPALANNPKSNEELIRTIRQGKGAMQSYRSFSDDQLEGLMSYIREPDGTPIDLQGHETKAVYLMDGYKRMIDEEDGLPLFSPPYGSLVAVDLNDGTIKWKQPLGEYPELVKLGMRNTGTRNFGGAVATAGGLVFIGATADEKFRAFDTETGEVLWEFQLPYGGYATPSVYEVGGRQFIVVCAGGGQKVHRTASGDLVYAFALPKK